MMKNIKVLVLEDDLETIGQILKVLSQIEVEKGVYFGLTVLSTHREVESYINQNKVEDYNLLLLDRDDYLGGSYHSVNLSLFKSDNIISISSVPDYNKQAKLKGVKRVVFKDYQKLEDFASRLKKELLLTDITIRK